MIDRDILLLLVGGAIGATASIATLFVMYWVEGMRLRRQWHRQDMVEMRSKQADINAMLANAMKQSPQDTDESQSGNKET